MDYILVAETGLIPCNLFNAIAEQLNTEPTKTEPSQEKESE